MRALATVCSCHFDNLATEQLTHTLKQSDTVCFEQTRDTASQVLNDAVLTLNHRFGVDANIFGNDTLSREAVLGFMQLVSSFQQRFRWDTTDVQTGTTEYRCTFVINPLLNTGRLQT